jgi:two-component SAPR family response regulator
LQRAESLRENDWEILSLGGVAVTVAGQVLEYEAKKVIELLLYLMTKGESVIWRELFTDLWWDVVNDNAVHVLVGRARKAFEGLAEFIIEGDLLRLKLLKPCTWDARVFEKEANTALSSNEFNLIEKAIRIYKGPFLKDFDSSWSNDQRSHYETLYAKLLELSVSMAPTKAQKQIAKKRLESFWEAI